MTPSRNIRNNVIKDIQLPMPNLDIPGKIIEIGERLEADHIVSMERITKWKVSFSMWFLPLRDICGRIDFYRQQSSLIVSLQNMKSKWETRLHVIGSDQ